MVAMKSGRKSNTGTDLSAQLRSRHTKKSLDNSPISKVKPSRQRVKEPSPNYRHQYDDFRSPIRERFG